MKTMNGITIDLGPNKFDMFTRAVIVNDLNYMAQHRGHEKLPYGFTKGSVARAKTEVDAILAENPDVAEALQRRQMVWDEIRNDFIAEADKVGLDVKDRFTNPEYFRHMVLDVLIENQGRVPKGPGKQWVGNVASRSYLKKRSEHSMDINANYFEAEFDAMAQIMMDKEILKTVAETDRLYNIAPQLKQMAKENGVENWRDLIPPSHVEWLPRPGRSFYRVFTIPEQLVDHLAQQGEAVIIPGDEIKQAIAMGRMRKSIVIPREVAETLDQFGQPVTATSLGRIANELTMAWKVWILTSPQRLIAYNTRNLFGDFNRLVAKEPKALRYVPESITELRKWGRGEPATGDLEEALQAGVIDSTMTLEELGEVGDSLILRRLSNAPHQKTRNLAKLWFKKAKESTVFRENVLRLAAYKHAKTQWQSGNRIMGYSSPAEVEAIDSDAGKVAHVARHLLGDYASVSEVTKAGRRFWVPFLSFQEFNLRGWIRGFMNSIHEGGSGRYVTLSAAGKTFKIASNLAKYAIGATGLMAAAMAFNNTFFPEEEKRLSPYDRNRPHLILGTNPDGSVKLFRGIDAFGEFLAWFGLGDAPEMVWKLMQGKMTYVEMLKEMAGQSLTKAYSTLGPWKSLMEIGLGRSMWPDATNPRNIRDRKEELAKLFSLDPEYRALTGKPGRPYIQQRSVLWSTVNLDEQNYFEIRSLAYDFNYKKYGKSAGGGFQSSPKSEAYYTYKKAVLFGDKEAARGALKEINKYGGTLKGLEQSIPNSHPLQPVKKDDRQEFYRWLLPSQRERIKGAMKWHNKLEAAVSRLR